MRSCMVLMAMEGSGMSKVEKWSGGATKKMLNTKNELNVWWEIIFSNDFLIIPSQVDQYADFEIPFDGRDWKYENKSYSPWENIADNSGGKAKLEASK